MIVVKSNLSFGIDRELSERLGLGHVCIEEIYIKMRNDDFTRVHVSFIDPADGSTEWLKGKSFVPVDAEVAP